MLIHQKNFKEIGKNLKKELAKINIQFTLGATYNILARVNGYADYNTYSASIGQSKENNPLNHLLPLMGIKEKSLIEEIIAWLDNFPITTLKGNYIVSLKENLTDSFDYYHDINHVYLHIYDVFLHEYCSSLFYNTDYIKLSNDYSDVNLDTDYIELLSGYSDVDLDMDKLIEISNKIRNNQDVVSLIEEFYVNFSDEELLNKAIKHAININTRDSKIALK